MKGRRSAGVTVIVGGDSYLAEEALEGLLRATVGPDRRAGVQTLYGDETAWSRVLDSAGMRSLFAERRAIVVRGAEGLKGEGDGLAAYLESPTPGVTLILLAVRPDKRRTAWKQLLDKAEVVSAEPKKGQALRAYVADHLRRRNLALTEEGFEEFLERVGQDLRRLMGELDKLEAYSQGGRALSAEDVAAVLGRGLAPPLYRLGDAMAERYPDRVLALAEALLEDGEEPPKILGTLHRSLRQVRGVLALRERRVSRDEMSRLLQTARLLPKQMAFKLPALIQASARWSEAELKRATLALGRADRGMKKGADARGALTVAVAEACGEVRARSGPRPGR
jgi:DNA polymerase III delta subunit